MTMLRRAHDLAAMVERGEFLESFPRFYSPDAVVRENDNAPRIGRPALIENEKRILATFKSVTGKARQVFATGDQTVIRWSFEFVAVNDAVFRLDELALQTWQDDLIVDEKFYYDPAQMASPSA